MKKFKKILAVALVVMVAVVFAPMIPGSNGKVIADTDWTQIGTSDCQYQIKTTGSGESKEVTLTIAPVNGTSGTLPDNYYDKKDWPWYASNENRNITRVVFDKGVKAGNSTKSMFQDCVKIIEINGLDNLDTTATENMCVMFAGCTYLESLDLSKFDTSKVTDMGAMFGGCWYLKGLDLSTFDTSKVTDMGDMFGECYNVKSLDLSKFDTSKVTDMGGMFDSCGVKSLDLSKFDTSKVTDMSGMFSKCDATSLDLSGFDTSNVTSMWFMFDKCKKLKNLNLSGFDTSKVKNMARMFRQCEELTSLDLSSFDASKIGNTINMFSGCSSLTTIYASNKLNLENVTNSDDMFTGCTSLVGGAGTKYDEENQKNKTYAIIDGGESSPGYFSYKISFDMKGLGTAFEDQKAGKGGKITKPEDPFIRNSNFGGWYKDKACKTAWDFGRDVVTDTTTLYAKWYAPSRLFIAKATAGKKYAKYTWNKVQGAAKYKVYQAKCNDKKYKCVKTTKACSFKKKKLRAKGKYKAYVVAYNSKGKAIAKTQVTHVILKGGKLSNATSVTAAKNISIITGKTTGLNARIAKKDRKKTILWKNHESAPIRYYSADKKIATVDAKGKVKGVKAGTAYIYSVSSSGACAVTKVIVEKEKQPE